MTWEYEYDKRCLICGKLEKIITPEVIFMYHFECTIIDEIIEDLFSSVMRYERRRDFRKPELDERCSAYS